MSVRINNLTRNLSDGFCFSDDLSINELSRLLQNRIPSPLAKLTWNCGDVSHSMIIPVEKGIPQISITKLPDSSGFICFERSQERDNCLLLDAHGEKRVRLAVPLALTRSKDIESVQAYFLNLSGPYVNPVNGKKGKFGVTAWVEYSGKYYFELDYENGEFLWGKPILD